MGSILDRINQIANNEGISVGALERKIGASKNVLARAIANKTDIQAKWLPIIAENYPKYSPDWLLTGNGEMLRSDKQEIVPVKNYDRVGCPYFNVDFQGGFDLLINDKTSNPEYYIDFPPFNKKGAVWCNVSGHSMEPEINSGDIILVRQLQDWQNCLVYGELYGIITSNNQRTIKRIRKAKNKDSYLLVPTNINYDQQEIETKHILHIFEVICAVKTF